MSSLPLCFLLKSKHVMQSVVQGSALTRDYCILLVTDSAIDAVGLLTNNQATVLASMLVSPLMVTVFAVMACLVVGAAVVVGMILVVPLTGISAAAAVN